VEIKNKTILLTGASTGIGKAIAAAFLEKQARVVVFGLHRPPRCSRFFKVDVGDERQVAAAMAGVKRIDVLVNNAGVDFDCEISAISSAQIEAMVNVNFKGMVWMCKHAVPRFGRGGCIVNISSSLGLRSVPRSGIYSATKAAMISLTETLAQELAGRKIRVNCLAPGLVATALWRKRFGARAGRILAEVSRANLLKRCGRPEEIAQAVLFLCGNEFIDGATVLVDGGQNICCA